MDQDQGSDPQMCEKDLAQKTSEEEKRIPIVRDAAVDWREKKMLSEGGARAQQPLDERNKTDDTKLQERSDKPNLWRNSGKCSREPAVGSISTRKAPHG